jgi:hypothetical protein
MKFRVLFLAAAFAVFTFQSCDELLNGIPVSFDIEENFTIPQMTAGTIELEETVQPDAETHAATVGGTPDDIKSIKINSLSVKIADPNSNLDFSAFEKVSVAIVADGLDEVVVASRDIGGEAIQTIHVDVNDVELADYLKKTDVTYKLMVETNSDIADPFEVTVKSNVTIQVQLSE